MSYDRRALRDLTLADNLEWLRTFGCIVEQRGELIYIDHPRLPEYKAWLFTRATPRALGELTHLASGEMLGPRTIFVDDDIADTTVFSLLAHARIVARNVTFAARVPPRAWRSSTRLVPATGNDWRLWSEVYSRGFGREELAAIDRERWRLAFGSTFMQHWFFVQKGSHVGVCQTSNGPLHGIYSFAFVPEARGVGPTLNGLRALMAYVSRQPSPWIYFEFLSQSSLAGARVRSAVGLTRVRTFNGYELPDVGKP